MNPSHRDVPMKAKKRRAGMPSANSLNRDLPNASTDGADTSVRSGTCYDLLLKVGEFIDPGSGRRGRLDVAFSGDSV